MNETRPRVRVVVVGAGFGGLRVARALRDTPVDVRLVDRNNFHTFSPLLYQVATAGLEPEEIAHPVRSILRGAGNLRYQLGEVVGIDYDRRCVLLADGEIDFDYLVLATGSATSYFGVPGAEVNGLGLKDLADATALRDQVLSNFEAAAKESDEEIRRRLMTIVIVGGGPTGVELAGALAELKRHVLTRDYPELRVSEEARVILVEATGSILGGFPVRLRAYALARLREMGVEVLLNAAVAEVTPDGPLLKSGNLIRAATAAWVAGVRAGPLSDSVGGGQTLSGRVITDETLQLPGHPNVFVIGDMAHAGVKGHAMLAPVAIQQGELVAGNILRQLRGEPLKAFHYRDLGTMATIGRQAAVAKVGPLSFTGFPAWLLWLTIHLVWLIGFRNRALVLINWAWNYVFFEQGVRLITPVPHQREKAAPGPAR